MSTTFLQQILNGKLSLAIMGEQKSYLSCGFKLGPITTSTYDLL